MKFSVVKFENEEETIATIASMWIFKKEKDMTMVISNQRAMLLEIKFLFICSSIPEIPVQH